MYFLALSEIDCCIDTTPSTFRFVAAKGVEAFDATGAGYPKRCDAVDELKAKEAWSTP